MRTVKLSDVVKRANTKEDRFNTSLLYYVGGEHIETDNVVIKERGLIKGSTIGPMFYFGFKKGDVLLVSRNPHLRKSGMVFFDGICSEKTFVLETNDERILLQDYLPFIFQSDHFWEYAESHKSGSVNFFLNWSTLANYEFNLPELDEQKKLAEVLWQIVDTMESYKKLLAKTDEMVKAKFVELIESGKWKIEKLGNITDSCLGKMLDKNKNKGSLQPYLANINIRWGSFDLENLSRMRFEDGEQERYGIIFGDLIICEGGEPGRCAIWKNEIPNMKIQKALHRLRCKSCLNNYYLYYWFVYAAGTKKLNDYFTGTTIKHLPGESLKKIVIPLPPLELQNQFADFVKKSEESKSAIQASLDSLKQVYKKIIAENIGGR